MMHLCLCSTPPSGARKILYFFFVMPGLVPGIHDLLPSTEQRKTWMAGTSPAMTPAT
jgi:hypothetical protein